MQKTKANVLKGLGIFFLTALLITSIVAVSITISNQNVDNTEIKDNEQDNDEIIDEELNQDAEIKYEPKLKANKIRIDLTMEKDSLNYPEDSFIVSITNLPTNATDEDKYLTITCMENIDEWLTLYTMKNGEENVLSSPYLFTSGQTVKVRLKKQAPIIGGYKVSLWVGVPSYDIDEVVCFVDIYIKTI